MALFRGVIRSEVLEMDTAINVILPFDRPAEEQETPCKVLYLLHGLSDNCDAWIRYTAIERYARKKGIAVIMPEVQRSFYLDMKYGLPYASYVAEELPSLCRRMFHISRRWEDTFVAGLSMGGYGAMKCGLSHPGLYAGCASFSGAVDLRGIIDDRLDSGKLRAEVQAGLGQDLALPADCDLFALAETVAQLREADRPGIFITCGQQDFLHEDNLRFKARLEEIGLGFEYREWPGEHEWGFWDRSVAEMLDFFLPSKV